MDLLQMQYFKTVAEFESVTKAAEILHISQPSLSVSIRKLEKELGVQLFDRINGKIRLNRTGKVFLSYVNKAFLDVQDARREVADQSGFGQRIISIAVSTMGLTEDLLSKYFAENSDVKFTQFVHSSETMLASMESAEVDFAISTEPIQSPEILWTPLLRDPVMVLTNENHPFREKPYVNLEDLSTERFVVQRSSFRPKGEYSDLLEQAGYNPEICFTTNELHNAYAMTEMGLGLMLVSYIAAKRLNEKTKYRVCAVPLRVQSPYIIGVALLKGHYLTKSANDFYQFTIEYYSKLAEKIKQLCPWPE